MSKTLAEIALDEGLVDRAALADAVRRADDEGEPLVVGLIRYAGVGEIALVGAIRRQARVSLADPIAVRLDSDALREVPRETCHRRRVLPLALQVHPTGPRGMWLAMADPTDQVAIAEVEHLTSCRVEPQLMTLSAVEELIASAYRGFVTKVMKRKDDDEPREGHVTARHQRIPDPADGDTAVRLRALVSLLVERGIIEQDELDRAVRALLERRDPEA